MFLESFSSAGLSKVFILTLFFSLQPWQRQTWRRWQCMRPRKTKCSSGSKRRSHQNRTRLINKTPYMEKGFDKHNQGLCPFHSVLLCLGGALQSRRLSIVGFFSSHPLRSGHPTMHLWRQEDFWVSGSHFFFNMLSNLTSLRLHLSSKCCCLFLFSFFFCTHHSLEWQL